MEILMKTSLSGSTVQFVEQDEQPLNVKDTKESKNVKEEASTITPNEDRSENLTISNEGSISAPFNKPNSANAINKSDSYCELMMVISWIIIVGK